MLTLTPSSLPPDLPPSFPFDIDATREFTQEMLSSYRKMHARLCVYICRQNGLISRDECLRFDGGSLTPEFVDRVFQECTSFGGEIDYKVWRRQRRQRSRHGRCGPCNASH